MGVPRVQDGHEVSQAIRCHQKPCGIDVTRRDLSIGEEKKWNPNVGKGIDKDKFVAAEKEKNRPYPKKIDIAVPANMKCGQVSL